MTRPVEPQPHPDSTSVLSRDHVQVRTLTLNRPAHLNALDTASILLLREKLMQADADPTVRVIVLTGAGRAFCAGADLSGQGGVSPSYTEHLHATFNPLVLTMRALGKPLIGALNGLAAGAGASIALACDLRVCGASASFIQIFSNIALIPDSGSAYFLPRLVGQGRAYELMALADRLPAEEALRLGVCQAVFPDASFAEDVQAYAQRFAARPAHALELTKRLLERADGLNLRDTLDLEAEWQQRAADHWEHAEGLRAFSEKRPADYRQAPPEERA